MNGYELAEEVLYNIGLTENNEISNNDAVRVISFFGYYGDSSRSTRIGFVCYCAREKIRKAFEQGLVYGDFKPLDELMESINNYIRHPPRYSFARRKAILPTQMCKESKTKENAMMCLAEGEEEE